MDSHKVHCDIVSLGQTATTYENAKLGYELQLYKQHVSRHLPLPCRLVEAVHIF